MSEDVQFYDNPFLGAPEYAEVQEAPDLSHNYKFFIIDRYGDLYLKDPASLKPSDLDNLVLALEDTGYLSKGNTPTEFSLKSAIHGHRNDYPMSSDDMASMYKLLEYRVGLQVTGDVVGIDLESFDREYSSLLKEFVKEGYINPIDYSDPHNVDYYNSVRLTLLDDFMNVSRIVPGLSDDPTLEERQALNPDGRSFVMISPDENFSDGSDLVKRIEMRAKWEAARDALEDAGANILMIDGMNDAGAAREVYVRDRALIIGDVAYIPDYREMLDWAEHEQVYMYDKESRQIADFLADNGHKVVHVEGAWFEGGNIVLHPSENQNTIFFGMGGATTDEHARILIEAINANQGEPWTLHSVPLMDEPIFYHLDLGMTYALPNGEVILYPGVTDEATYASIVDVIGAENIIEIDRDTASTFVTNFNHAGNTIVMTGSAPQLTEDLENRGYRVVTPDQYDLPNLQFGQGGVHCMTNEITYTVPKI